MPQCRLGDRRSRLLIPVAHGGGEGEVAFVDIVANRLAFAVSLRLQLDVDALLKLLHRGIDPPRK